MRMNNKGALQGVALGFVLTTALNVGISQLPAVKTDYQIKKITQICVAGGGDLDICEMSAELMSNSSRKIYLKDTLGNPRSDHKDITNISKIRHL